MNRKKYLFVMFSFCFISFCAYVYFFDKPLSYESFNDRTKIIYEEHFNRKYANVEVIQPTLTSLPGNESNIWSSIEFNSIDGTMSTITKVTLLLDFDDFFTKIDFVYAPEISDKTYLNLNYLDHLYLSKTIQNAKDLRYYSAQFTTKGMQVEVLSFSNSNADDVKMLKKQNEIIDDLQKFLLIKDF